MNPLLQAHGLARLFDGRPVWQGLDLVLQPGEVVAIVGESGMGKSTLLNVLAGLDRPDAGQVVVAGTDLTALGDDACARWRRSHLGFVFQAFHVLPHLTVAQNVGLPLMLLGQADAGRVDAALTAVGLSEMGPRLPRTLSGGQLQRVAVARALVHRPSLVLADEPTGNLDPETGEQVLSSLVAQARSGGSALLLVTHSSWAAQRADRVLRLTPSGLVALHPQTALTT